MIDLQENVVADDAVATLKKDDVVDGPLSEQLIGQAREQGVALKGDEGPLGQLTKPVLKSALEGDITDYFCQVKHERARDSTSNARIGSRTVLIGFDVHYGLVTRSDLKIRDCGYWVDAQLVIKRQGISELGATALAVMEDLEKSEYRVGQVDAGAPFLFGSATRSASMTRMILVN